jgi:hypothetical protein
MFRFESLFGIDDLRENVLASSVAGFASVDRMQTESDAFFDDSQVVKAEMGILISIFEQFETFTDNLW